MLNDGPRLGDLVMRTRGFPSYYRTFEGSSRMTVSGLVRGIVVGLDKDD